MSETSYTAAQEQTLGCVLDAIIPPSADGRMPGAGEIGLGRVIAEKAPDLQPLVVAGLAALDEQARGAGAEGFAALDPAARREALETLSVREPAFLPGLIFQTYVAYYQHPRVVEALGLEARPPHPLGYDLEPGDLSGLEAVRARNTLYRPA